jgi:aspartokinase-like uncharacterized kinase
MDAAPPIVVKLGGSLLTLPDLFDRLQSLMDILKPHRLLLIPGGGSAADEVRRLDHRFCLSAENAHRAAIAAMTLNATLLARLSSFLCVVESRPEAERVWASGGQVILDAASFLKEEERCADCCPLPALWDVTSDSIAGWIASRWPASRMILAKSCEMDGGSVRELVARNKLDAWFSRLPGTVPAFWLNLRRDPLTLLPLSSESSPR